MLLPIFTADAARGRSLRQGGDQASGVGVSGRVADAAGTTLAEFKHRKHSGIGVGGGQYVKFLSDDTRDVAAGLARFLSRWAEGGDLTEED